MSLLVVVAVVVVCIFASAVVIERSRLNTARRVDAVAATLRDEPAPPSPTLTVALARLDQLARQTDVAAPDRLEMERYRASLASMDLGVVLVDEKGAMAYRNEYAASFLDGRHGDALVGLAIDELAHAASGGARAERRLHIYGPPRRTLFVTADPIEEDGLHLGAVVLVDDITEQERVDTIRRDFIANISHELRTPLGAVALLTETLVGETDPEVIARLASRVSSEVGRLAHTIDDLLQLSRIEHGSDEHFQPVLLQTVIAAAVDRVRTAADHLRVEIGSTMPEEDLLVRGDALQLTSAITNLVDNGVKYMGDDGGLVSLRARQVEESIELVVQDSGVGIPRQDLDRIFERFYRVDRGRSRNSGGTGLGLAIVRNVVANHGGRVEVDSTEGEGSTFTVVLPALDPGARPGHTTAETRPTPGDTASEDEGVPA